MPVPIVYRKSNETSVASYDALDLATGQGYKKYYAALATNSTSTTKFLSPQVIDADVGDGSYAPSLTYGGNNVADAIRFDYDYDLLFNTPQVIKGKAIFNLLQFAIGTGGGATGAAHVVINVYHVNSSGTETSLGQVTSAETTSSTATAVYQRKCLELDLAKRHFAIGEKLRINIIVYTRHAGIGNTTGGIFFDPQNNGQTYGSVTLDTDFFVIIPYKIDL